MTEAADTNPGVRVLYDIDPAIKTSNLKVNLKTIWVTEFNEESAKEFATEMHLAHNTGQPVIPVIIDSYGGEVYSLLSMIAEIRSSELPVATVVKGKAMSCGSFLAAAGTRGYRYCDPESTYMIHEVSSMAWGKTEEIKADAAETDRLNRRVFRLLADSCGQPANYFSDLVHNKNHADWYVTPSQARKHCMVDHVYLPKMEVNVTVDWRLS